YGHEVTARRLADLGGKPVLRRDANGAPFVTDGGNILYDCAGFAPIDDAEGLAEQLDAAIGVIEHGLFVGMTTEAYMSDAAGTVRILRRER
ncbi:MAG: ribose-5-phosphate isomerase A, partial [Stellaceae bacterium]